MYTLVKLVGPIGVLTSEEAVYSVGCFMTHFQID